MERLKNRTALITGAASYKGIGRAVALAFAAEGARVVCFDADEQGCAEAAQLICDNGGEAISLAGDVSKEQNAQKAVDDTVAAFGRIDVLVNCAGIARFKPILEVSEEEWDLHMAVNLKGCFLFCKAAAKAMIAQGDGGAIINISSISATLSGEHKVHYCASKAGVHLLTKGLAIELGPHNIRVNSVSPGAIDTNIIKENYIQEILSKIPPEQRTVLGRSGKGLDVAPAAVFLASDEAAFITGADIVVDGGLTAGQRLPKDN